MNYVSLAKVSVKKIQLNVEHHLILMELYFVLLTPCRRSLRFILYN